MSKVYLILINNQFKKFADDDIISGLKSSGYNVTIIQLFYTDYNSAVQLIYKNNI